MKTRQTLLCGLAGLGFVLAWPTQAALVGSPDWDAATVRPPALEYREGGFVVAKRDDPDSRTEARRDQRDARSKANTKPQPRDAERYNEPEHFGYGYERRQEPPRDNNDRGRH